MSGYLLRYIMVYIIFVTIFMHAKSLYAADPTVYVDTVISKDIQSLVWFPGSIVAEEQAVIAAEGEGLLLLLREVGELIKQGEVLAKLDDDLLQLELREAEADVNKISAGVEFLSGEMERFLKLTDQAAVSVSKMSEVRYQYNESQFNLISAIARKDRLQMMLKKMTVYAPFEGVISERFRHPGERVSFGMALVALINPQRIALEADIPAQYLKYLSLGQNLVYKADNLESEGIVIASVPTDMKRHQARIRLSLKSMIQLQPGEAVRVGIPQGPRHNAIALRRDALVIRESEIYVYKVLDNKTARKVVVELGQGYGEWIEVMSDQLSLGDKVIIRGAERLSDNAAVVVTIPSTELIHN